MKKRINSFFKYFFLLLSSLVFAIVIYISNYFYSINFEQILFTIKNSESTGISSLSKGINFVIVATIIIFIIFVVLFKILEFFESKLRKTFLNIKIMNKEKKLIIFPINSLIKSFIVLLISILFALNCFDFFGYMRGQTSDSDLYEEYYVNPKDVDITFPTKKRNLIYIYLESMEATMFDKENGGSLDTTYIPNLQNLASENINFSNNDKLGGFYSITNTGWTGASLVSQTSGITYNSSFDSVTQVIDDEKFLPGLTTIGDILSNNGYKNYFMMGSSASFASRRDYFTLHGDYEILDYDWAIDSNKIDNDYNVWWGYEDKKLFSFAKEKLTSISKNKEPFNFTMLTADTHFIDGYLDETCEDNLFDSQYANVFHCNDSMIYKFIKWVQEQDFYKNTTIVIVGDHTTMQKSFFDDSSNRVVYNTIINSTTNDANSNNRLFSTLDMFPTTLAAIGVKIAGDRLGLGVNLFSGKNTIIETYGVDYINKNIGNKSNYFDDYFK